MRILVFAYACEPGRGSEPGAGWGVVQAAAAAGECVVLTGPAHLEAIRRHQDEHPDSNVRFVEVPEPQWAPRRRGRVLWFLVYLGWLRRARRIAVELTSQEDFDVALHATYSVYWLPSPVGRLGVPSMWGPVGGAVATPRRLRRLLGWRGRFSEAVERAAVRLGALMPATRRTWKRATTVVAQNEETRDRLPPAVQSRTDVLNHGLYVAVPAGEQRQREPFIAWVSPLEARKGPRLAIHALAHTSSPTRLVMVGDGPERNPVERLALRLGVASRLELRGWVPRQEVFELMDSAAAVLFTGLREEGGISLSEGLLRGSPLIVLSHGGARALAQRSVDPARVDLIVPGTVETTARAMADAMSRYCARPPFGGDPHVSQEAAIAELAGLLRSATEG